jgi:Putative  PD-(D/E)XK family member, (DUF4420)
MTSTIGIRLLREIVAGTLPPDAGEAEDYRIAAPVGPAFLARGRSSTVTLLIPLAAASGAVARSGGGFTLTSAPRVAFDHGGRRWEQSAAILECTQEKLADAFLVLVTDVARRLPSSAEEITWPKIISWVEEWQALLSRRTTLSVEEQLGLWGELWLMSQAKDADRLFAAWRGPEADAVDFFHDGAALEVKVSRRAHVHHVSQSQVDAPRGEYVAYFLSMWVGVEQVRGVSLAELVDKLLHRVSDPAAFLKQLARVGYSLQDREAYATRFVVLEPPRWFHAEDIPRVRSFDEGISLLRYIVTLDADARLDDEHALDLWRHFCEVEAIAEADPRERT